MSQDFEIAPLQDASVLSLDDLKTSIVINPEYQREGQVWPLAKKQLLIDTLLNRYDVPKLYFHRLVGEHAKPGYAYSVIDGRQRLEAIWEFLRDDFPLADDFKLLDDPSVDLAGKYFKEIGQINARVATRLFSRSLAVMVVTTDDIDYIEDMFTRLNDGAPLNAAEKRNSFGGALPKITRDLAQHEFFTDRIRVSSTRYRHLDMVSKLLWLTKNLEAEGAIADTKKATIDTFFRAHKSGDPVQFDNLANRVRQTLDAMASAFGSRDPLLKSSGMIPVYYLAFLIASLTKYGRVARSSLQKFEEDRERNRELFKAESDQVNFRMLEFDELAQSSNDAASIKARVEMLGDYIGLKTGAVLDRDGAQRQIST